jgi:hypothetical protein
MKASMTVPKGQRLVPAVASAPRRNAPEFESVGGAA